MGKPHQVESAVPQETQALPLHDMSPDSKGRVAEERPAVHSLGWRICRDALVQPRLAESGDEAVSLYPQSPENHELHLRSACGLRHMPVEQSREKAAVEQGLRDVLRGETLSTETSTWPALWSCTPGTMRAAPWVPASTKLPWRAL